MFKYASVILPSRWDSRNNCRATLGSVVGFFTFSAVIMSYIICILFLEFIVCNFTRKHFFPEK